MTEKMVVPTSGNLLLKTQLKPPNASSRPRESARRIHVGAIPSPRPGCAWPEAPYQEPLAAPRTAGEHRRAGSRNPRPRAGLGGRPPVCACRTPGSESRAGHLDVAARTRRAPRIPRGPYVDHFQSETRGGGGGVERDFDARVLRRDAGDMRAAGALHSARPPGLDLEIREIHEVEQEQLAVQLPGQSQHYLEGEQRPAWRPRCRAPVPARRPRRNCPPRRRRWRRAHRQRRQACRACGLYTCSWPSY